MLIFKINSIALLLENVRVRPFCFFVLFLFLSDCLIIINVNRTVSLIEITLNFTGFQDEL